MRTPTKQNKNLITVFEHESVYTDRGEHKISPQQFNALFNYSGNGVPYFSIIKNGIRFNQHVGVIQIGKLTIEVLPKADNNQQSELEEKRWRDILVEMLRAVNGFEIKSTSESSLKIKPNTILDLYIEIFINEVEYLLHTGLVKQYRKKEGNLTSLKGNLLFGKHIQQNLIHREKFYTRHSKYDKEHKLHCILYKTIHFLKKINTNPTLNSRIGSLLLNFPEMPQIKITEHIFDRMIITRKTQSYSKAVNIAKMLLLKYHPDLTGGRHDVLALMFDMNLLWEKFVYMSLRKHKERSVTVKEQVRAYFWQNENEVQTTFKADIVIQVDKNRNIVLDTKWKNLNGKNPSPEDLRQMYAYHHYYSAEKTALVYPGSEPSKLKKSCFLEPQTRKESSKKCGLIFLSVGTEIKQWQKCIYHEIFTQLIKC